MCGDIFINYIITNFLQNVPVKKIFGEDIDKSLRLTFWDTLYIVTRKSAMHTYLGFCATNFKFRCPAS